MTHLFCFGFGFTAEHLAKILPREAWQISGTTRKSESLASMAALDVRGYIFEQLQLIPSSVTHVLASIPPDETGDPVVQKFGDQLAKDFQWIAYLSTTGVYGDRQGGVVTEDSALNPTSKRARRRVLAESQWRAFKAHIFRLPGIYGPGRSQLDALREGTAQRIVKEGQIFSRIHVEDIAGILEASIARPDAGRIYNVADNEPCPPQDVVTYAAELLGMQPPPEVAYEEAKLSPMARTFYNDSKRVSNVRMKSELGYVLKYPNYRMGLRSLELASHRPSPALGSPSPQWDEGRKN